MRSEWTKLRSLPSTLWLLLATVALVAGGGLLAALLQLSSLPRGHAAIAAFDPTQLSLTGVGLAELTAGALGRALITGEYATGQVRLTFTAVPAPAAGAVGQGGRAGRGHARGRPVASRSRRSSSPRRSWRPTT